MERHGSRRRSSDQRNLLYNEPSMMGALVVIGLIALVIAIILVVLFGNVFSPGS